jgi:S1-C subfamily serine protease
MRRILVPAALAATFAAGAADDFSSIAPRVMPSVVQVVVERKAARKPAPGEEADAKVLPAAPQEPRAGSGIIVRADGRILTVAHLLERAERIVVHLEDGRELPARLLGRDRRSDELRPGCMRTVAFQYGSLGVVTQAVPADLAKALGLPRGAGALVKSVDKGMPAERASNAAGDVIVRVSGEEVRAPPDVARIVAPLKPGSSVTLEVRRRNATQVEKIDLVVADAGD